MRYSNRGPIANELQPYVPLGPGELDRGFFSKVLPIIGQGAPQTRERNLMTHGRDFSGFGSFATQAPYDPTFKSDSVQKLESDDDVQGSGIFDDYGFKGTVNRSLGVFADHPSMPGYVQREIEFAPSKQVENMSSGAAVIYVPGGGMSYIDHGHDHLSRTGFPDPCPAQICGQDAPDGWNCGPMKMMMPSVPAETDYHPVEDNVGNSVPTTSIVGTGSQARPVSGRLPTNPSDDGGSIGRQTYPTVAPRQAGAAITPNQTQRFNMTNAANIGRMSMQTPIVKHMSAQQPVQQAQRQQVSRVNSMTRQPVTRTQPSRLAIKRRSAVATNGFGDDAPTPISSYIIGGLAVGVAAAIAASMWGKK